MYNEGAPEFFVDQGSYYPAVTNYGYFCTGFESPVEWEDHHNFFSTDGPEIQYAGTQSESLPYVYYTPSYGYAQSPYNPYNPYIPGAVMGDNPYIGSQQYYTVPPYQNPSPTFIPVVIQPDIIPHGASEPLLDPGISTADGHNGTGFKPKLPSASAAYPKHPPKSAKNQTFFWPRVSDGSSKQIVVDGSVSSASFSSPASKQVPLVRTAAVPINPIEKISTVKQFSNHNQYSGGVPVSNGISDFGSSASGQPPVDKLQTVSNVNRNLNHISGEQGTIGEQNRGHIINRLESQFSAKALATKAGDGDAKANVTINADNYNRDDFQVAYVSAKFFVIKSYSEDDVHKSIKYNVWSSTPHGNKKLQAAYDDAQKVAAGKHRGCPIFLFFSVNASGQFCGVAEMIGPVDFQKDMDFWQQDKWSGSFPVKWHIIKDVPNSHLKHIVLANNEYKPVTNSRDTQEVMFKQGIEMLKIFKNHTMRASLLDDFLYYENQQKIMLEEKAKILPGGHGNSFVVLSSGPVNKLNYVPKQDDKIIKCRNSDKVKENFASSSGQITANSEMISDESLEQINVDGKHDVVSTLRIGSVTLNPKQEEFKPTVGAEVASLKAEPAGIVTVGSMPIKVDGFAKSSGFLTVGTIPLNPKALQARKGVDPATSGS